MSDYSPQNWLDDDPTTPLTAIRLNYLEQGLATHAHSGAGLQVHDAVACATTANVTLSGEQTIDGVATSGSAVLVKDQTDAKQNGVYTTSSGAWSRRAAENTGAELISAYVFVS